MSSRKSIKATPFEWRWSKADAPTLKNRINVNNKGSSMAALVVCKLNRAHHMA